MRVLLFLSILGFFYTNSSIAQVEVQQKGVEEAKVQVYYFHHTRRCATCNAVEKVSMEAVNDHYGDEVCFSALNLDEQKGEDTAGFLGVSGQSLIVVSGDKQVDLTNEAFLFARPKPEKLVNLLKEKIDKFL